MMGVSPAAITARAFALSGALAGLAGATMTAAFGAVGYGLSATLTLKALAAAIVGGIGSLPGAFLGDSVGAAETGWSALFPMIIATSRFALPDDFYRPAALGAARQQRGDDPQPVPAPVLTGAGVSHILTALADPARGGSNVQCLRRKAENENVIRPDALAGVRTRRILALCIDFVLVSLLVAAIWFASIVLTLGLALFFLHLTRFPPLADDRLPASLRELPGLRIGQGAGRRFSSYRRQRRANRANADLVGAFVAPKPTNEHYALFRSYLDRRHPRHGGMADMSSLDFAMMVEDTHIDTVLTEYRPLNATGDGLASGPLLAVCLTDRLADGLSLVYSFYASRHRPPLSRQFRHFRPHREARRLGLPHVYLGYWVEGSKKRATRPPISPRSASACTAGRGWSGRRAASWHERRDGLLRRLSSSQ